MLSVADGERDDLVAKMWQLKWLNVSEVYVPNDKRTLAWSLGKEKKMLRSNQPLHILCEKYKIIYCVSISLEF